MNLMLPNLQPVILPLAIILGSFLIGFTFERIVISKVKNLAANTKWEGDEIIVSSFRGTVTMWFVIAGIYIAILNVPLGKATAGLFQKILLIFVILSVTLLLMRITTGFIKIYTCKSNELLPSTTIFINLTKFIFILIGTLVVLQSLGISVTPIITTLGIGGLAVALALQDTLSNLFSGINIILSGKVRPGDYIKLDTGEEGFVTDVTWRNTSIRTMSNNMIIVPNAKLAATITTNYFLPEKEMSILIDVGVSYGSDLEKVERATIEVGTEVMKENSGGVPEFDPFIRYHTFGDFSIKFTVVLRTREFTDQYVIKHEFIKKLHKRYREEGIEIPFPIRTIYYGENKNM